MFWLTQQHFATSHYEIGSGTSLQPLLRFGDRFSDFLFVDFDCSLADVVQHLTRGVASLERLANQCNHAAPLRLDGLEQYSDLRQDDIELAMSPGDVVREIERLLTPNELRGYMSTFAVRARQWGVTSRITRCIPHVDGTIKERPLQLRMVGGEGIMTYIAMGGLERAPAYVGTIQTGPGEEHRGPLARLFTRQNERGRALPEVWVRGTTRNPYYEHYKYPESLRPAPPFDRVGQSYANWQSDRSYPRAQELHREVKAWIRSEPSSSPKQLGPHTLYPALLDAARVRAAGTSCLPVHLAERLGVDQLANVHVVARPPGPLNTPLAESLRNWLASDAFQNADDAVYVPYGYEDELSVVTRWLATFTRPAVSVYLPSPLDFGAAVRTCENRTVSSTT
jgi:hypothetical protein